MTISSVDTFLRRRRRVGYDCRSFMCEVWEAQTGEKIADREARSFERLEAPVDPCLVRFRRSGESHVGVFLRGRVLHLATTYPRFEPLHHASAGYSDVRFYR